MCGKFAKHHLGNRDLIKVKGGQDITKDVQDV